MLSNFKIDQAATFAGLVFLSCEPKKAFGSDTQETTKDGLAKWEVQVLGAFKSNFGTTNNEVVKVGIASKDNPANSIPPFSPISLLDFEVGVMEKTKRDREGAEKVIGVTVWFRASGIRSASGTTAKAA
jgi:hypothetical protein